MKKMNVFACFVALLHCVWSQTPSPAICQAYIDSNNCDFYRDCVETRANCGEDGYPLGYGYKYCQRFADLSNMFDEQGMQWIQDVRQCLMQKLKDSSAYENAATSPDACGDLQTEGFNSHPDCYVDHGFCSPSFFTRANLEGLWNVFDFGDFLSRAALSQVGRTISRCSQICLSSVVSIIEQLQQQILFGILEFFEVFSDPCNQVCGEGDDDTDRAVVFLLDASGSIGDINFDIMKNSTASAAVNFAMNGARVGVVLFSSASNIAIPLQKWENTAQLRTNIENIVYVDGSTNTAAGISTTTSILGSEGTRIILLFTDGQSDSQQDAENAANAAKQAGISIYAGGIGSSVSEEELNNLVSYPPGDYRVSVAGFSATTFVQEIQPLIASSCLTPQQATAGQQQEGMLAEEGDIRSIQYTLPPEGLTLVINVPEGEANIYGSYTIRNPTYFTADFMTGGSGVLTYYIPSPQSSRKRQAGGGEAGNAFISVIAKKPNTTFILNATDGDVLTMREPSAPQYFSVIDSSSQETNFTWSQPLFTNGIVHEYTLRCTAEMSKLSDIEEKINIAFYESNLQLFATLSDLQPRVVYNCNVRASNEAGYGPAATLRFESGASGTKGTSALGVWVLLLSFMAVFQLY